MKTFVIVGVAALIGLASCESSSLSYNPQVPIQLWVSASAQVDTGGGVGRPIDVYAFRVSDPAAFQNANLVPPFTGAQRVPGGEFIERHYIQPGVHEAWLLPPMGSDEYTHLGIVADYDEPYGPQVAVAKIPGEGGLILSFGPRSIRTFASDRTKRNPLVPGSN